MQATGVNVYFCTNMCKFSREIEITAYAFGWDDYPLFKCSLCGEDYVHAVKATTPE